MLVKVCSGIQNLPQCQTHEVVFTHNEGLTIEQTSERISQVMNIDTAQFNRLCYDTAFIKETGFISILSGRLSFPDTYRFPKDATVREIIRKWFMCFDNVYSLYRLILLLSPDTTAIRLLLSHR
jgi:cell division protein YceG involved in septum cleavage